MSTIGLKSLAKINDNGLIRPKGAEFEATQERFLQMKTNLGERLPQYLEINYIKTDNHASTKRK